MQSLTLLAVLASTTAALVPRGQDSSNFLLDTAPQGYSAVLTQISDGQVQVPTIAPSAPAVSAPPVVPSVVIPPIESSLVYTLPVEPTTWEASLPIETFPTVPVVPPVETPSAILPPTTAVAVPPVLITETASLIAPNATTTLRTTGAPSASAPASETTPPTGEAGMRTVSSFGLVAAAAVALLL